MQLSGLAVSMRAELLEARDMRMKYGEHLKRCRILGGLY
jgi:hypothetical protein